MKKVALFVLMLALVLVVQTISAQAGVVLVGSSRVGDVLTTVARVYMDKNPGSEVKILFNLLDKAQDRVLAGEADAVMVTEKYYKDLNTETLKFTPLVKRSITKNGKIVGYTNYGIAAVKISPELQKFLSFINSEEGRDIIKEIPNVYPL